MEFAVVVATAQRNGELLITKLALEGPALRARAEIYGRGECASKNGRMGTLKIVLCARTALRARIPTELSRQRWR